VPKVSEAHLEARRQQIMDASLACFAREGFHRTTMQHIVAETGLSPGAIYRYFESKDEIIEAITSERHDRERELLREAAHEDPQEALSLLAESFFGSLRGPRAREERRVRVQIYAESVRNPRIRRLVRRGIDEPRGVLAGLIREAQDAGQIAARFDADALARVVIATFHGLILQQVWDERVDVDAYFATLEGLYQLVFDEG
jgi:AcrR family transcriptional regulator